MRLRALAAASLLAVVAVAGCGGDDTDVADDGTISPSVSAAAGDTAAGRVTIKSFTFAPQPITAHVGDTLTVVNEDDAPHSLTAVDGSFTTGIFTKGTKTFTVSTAGELAFHCEVHNFMTGVIQVDA